MIRSGETARMIDCRQSRSRWSRNARQHYPAPSGEKSRIESSRFVRRRRRSYDLRCAVPVTESTTSHEE